MVQGEKDSQQPAAAAVIVKFVTFLPSWPIFVDNCMMKETSTWRVYNSMCLFQINC